MVNMCMYTYLGIAVFTALFFPILVHDFEQVKWITFLFVLQLLDRWKTVLGV